MLAARSKASKRCDYSVLMLKRLASSSFAAKHHVFPGGLLDKADHSKDWLDIYSAFVRDGSSVVSFLQKSACCPVDRSLPTFVTKRTDEWALPAEVTFKICALRETFEETGVLLVRRLDQPPGDDPEASCFARDYGLTAEQRQEWTEHLRADSGSFTELCRSLNCVPDIWSLRVWSCWLTPSHAPKRFDTPFFTACLDEQPEVTANATEHSSHTWVDPTVAQDMRKAGNLSVGPPQLMELARLASHTRLDSLCKFVAERAHAHGAERWTPLRMRCADAWLSTYPGDSLYGNFLSGEEVAATAAELLEGPGDRHVLVSYNADKFRFFANIRERRGHPHPVINDFENN